MQRRPLCMKKLCTNPNKNNILGNIKSSEGRFSHLLSDVNREFIPKPRSENTETAIPALTSEEARSLHLLLVDSTLFYNKTRF